MLTDEEVTRAAALAQALARGASATIRHSHPRTALPKANAADVVTDIDLAVERTVTRAVHQHFPLHRVEGEELGASGAAAGAPTWYLDPVDGTTNLAHGIPWACFSLAVADEDGPAVGVVADPFRDEVWTAQRGGGAFLNGVALRRREATSLAGSVVLTEWSGHEPWPGMFTVLAALSLRMCTVRIMGSSALSLVTAASGRAAGAIIGSYHHVDDMAGVLIAREAGACVYGRGTDGVLVAGAAVAAELHDLWAAAADGVDNGGDDA